MQRLMTCDSNGPKVGENSIGYTNRAKRGSGDALVDEHDWPIVATHLFIWLDVDYSGIGKASIICVIKLLFISVIQGEIFYDEG